MNIHGVVTLAQTTHNESRVVSCEQTTTRACKSLREHNSDGHRYIDLHHDVHTRQEFLKIVTPRVFWHAGTESVNKSLDHLESVGRSQFLEEAFCFISQEHRHHSGLRYTSRALSNNKHTGLAGGTAVNGASLDGKTAATHALTRGRHGKFGVIVTAIVQIAEANDDDISAAHEVRRKADGATRAIASDTIAANLFQGATGRHGLGAR